MRVFTDDILAWSVYWDNKYEIHQGNWSNKSFLDALAKAGVEVIAMEKYHELGVYLLSFQPRSIHEVVANPVEWTRYHAGIHYINSQGGLKTSLILYGQKYIPEGIRRKIRKIRKQS